MKPKFRLQHDVGRHVFNKGKTTKNNPKCGKILKSGNLIWILLLLSPQNTITHLPPTGRRQMHTCFEPAVIVHCLDSTFTQCLPAQELLTTQPYIFLTPPDKWLLIWQKNSCMMRSILRNCSLHLHKQSLQRYSHGVLLNATSLHYIHILVYIQCYIFTMIGTSSTG